MLWAVFSEVHTQRSAVSLSTMDAEIIKDIDGVNTSRDGVFQDREAGLSI